MPYTVDTSRLTGLLREQLPGTLAVYLFGSHASGAATRDSDLDLAVYLDAPVDSLRLWGIAQGLARQLGTDVDLVDLATASTVLQYQVITTGRRLWAADARAAIYESFILSEKTALDEARAGLLADIAAEGTVYAR
jgi:predicted nucleotidyltransferase